MDNDDDLPEGPPKFARKGRGKYADRPYDVGKGKPPREHQFKRGNGGGGRKKGSRNRTDFDKMLDERVVIGEDRLGKPKRKRWREIINLQLLKQAAQGDLAAIRVVKEFELKLALVAYRAGVPPPTAAEVAQAEAEKAEKAAMAERLGRQIADHLEVIATLKRAGLIEIERGRAVVTPAALAAIKAHKASQEEPGPAI
jgi:hypothetical protein